MSKDIRIYQTREHQEEEPCNNLASWSNYDSIMISVYRGFPFFWSVKKYRGRQCRIRTLPLVEDERGSSEGKQRLVLSEPRTGIQTTQSLPNQPFTLTGPLCIANALRTASLKTAQNRGWGKWGEGNVKELLKNASESRVFHHAIRCAVHALCLHCVQNS